MILCPFHWKEARAESVAIALQPSPMARTKGRGSKKPVEQLTLEGEPIRQFPSLSEAARSLGIHDSNIHRALTGGRKTCGGYLWRYVSREQQILAPKFGGAYSKAKASQSGGVV